VSSIKEEGQSGRRGLLALLLFAFSSQRQGCRAEETPWRQLSPEEQSEVTKMADVALNAKNAAEEEVAWTRMLERYAGLPQVQVIVISNRGNSRARQGKLQEALEDYNRAIELSPAAADPHLNRGAVYEALGRLEEALVDYDIVLRNDPQDPAAWNNRGNALLGLKRFAPARDSFQKALSLSGSQTFAFAAVNLALTQYELGEDDEALRGLKSLLARYAEAFPDARAAYALILWDRGDRIFAESEWDRATAADPRYKSLDWVTEFRRWPPRMTSCLSRFAATTSVKVK